MMFRLNILKKDIFLAYPEIYKISGLTQETVSIDLFIDFQVYDKLISNLN